MFCLDCGDGFHPSCGSDLVEQHLDELIRRSDTHVLGAGFREGRRICSTSDWPLSLTADKPLQTVGSHWSLHNGMTTIKQVRGPTESMGVKHKSFSWSLNVMDE